MKNGIKSLKNKELYKETLSLFWPIALSNLITLSLSVSDNFFASRIGGGMVSSVIVGAQVGQLLVFLLNGISGVLLILISRKLGRGDENGVYPLALFATLLALSLGILFMLASHMASQGITSVFTKDSSVIKSASGYLSSLSKSFPPFAISATLTALMRGLKMQKVSFLSSLIAIFVNVSLNYLIVFKNFFAPGAGIEALGYTTLVARICECAVLLFALVIKKREKLKNLKNLFQEAFHSAHSFLRIGAPTILGQVVWGVNSLFATLVVGRRLSSSALAALSVANLMHNLSYVAINALSLSSAAIYSSLLGEKREDEAKSYVGRAEVIFLLLGGVSSLLIFLSSNSFISIFSLPEESASIAKSFLLVLSVTVIGTSYQSGILYGILRARGEAKFAFLCDLFFVFLLIMPYSFAAAVGGFAPFMVFAALKSDQVLKCLLTAKRVRKNGYLRKTV